MNKINNVYEYNIQQALCMPKHEREVLTTKLKAELAEFKERDRMYIEKRRELQELEMMYRKKSDAGLGSTGRIQKKIDTNQEIIEHLLQQIEEGRERLKDHKVNKEDTEEKIYSQRESISQREQEIDELKNRITQRADKGQDLRRVLDKLVIEYKLLLEEEEQEQEELE
jgi:chromosome segregation ATPase